MPERQRCPLADGEIDYNRFGKTSGQRSALALQSQTCLWRTETVVGKRRRHREVGQFSKRRNILRRVERPATTNSDQCLARRRQCALQAQCFFYTSPLNCMEQSRIYTVIPKALSNNAK